MAGSSGLASPKSSVLDGNHQNCNIFEHGVSKLVTCLSAVIYHCVIVATFCRDTPLLKKLALSEQVLSKRWRRLKEKKLKLESLF